ncbi:antA/AntB antirepressor family protein [Mannheimia haemolytica]|uniref:antA/AntB antirepressor family protein n=1 Tax=Mannheimia haemolytica TaxID=75985 RepID=UPI0013775DD2|nr:antA/AntB antirepressor family protein [Mannheimia haemolytica]NBB67539.1 phage antirepressor Ant [Mannheimia haemolytica]
MTKPQLDLIAELLPVQHHTENGQTEHFIDARQLHEFLESKQEFANWIRNRIKKYGFVESVDFFTVDKFIKRKKARGASKSIDYRLSLTMAKELAMVENNEQGRQARRYFIACEEALKQVAPEVQAQLAQLWQDSRDEAKKPYRPLADALKRCLERQGKQPERWHYIGEIRMINTIILGIDPEKWKKQHGITGNVRENLTADQLERLAYLERADEVLLDSGNRNFYDRKRKLEQMHRERFGYIANSEDKRLANIQKLKETVMKGGKNAK